MNRLQHCFDTLKKNNKKALVPYITAGDPDLHLSLSLMQGFVKNGADIIELGVPFSDPVADGPVIEKAHARALKSGTHMQQVLHLVSEFRNQDQKTPIVLMTYVNPLEIMGYANFAKKAVSAGVDAVLIVDLPPEESAEIFPLLHHEGLDCIYLVSPNTSEERLQLIQRYCSGYLYYVSLKGTTGSNTLNTEEVARKVNHLRQSINLPILVGFGVHDVKTAAAVAKIADGVIVGSAIVEKIADNVGHPDKLVTTVNQFVQALREVV